MTFGLHFHSSRMLLSLWSMHVIAALGILGAAYRVLLTSSTKKLCGWGAMGSRHCTWCPEGQQVVCLPCLRDESSVGTYVSSLKQLPLCFCDHYEGF